VEPAHDVVDENDIQHRLAALADELHASGDLRGEVWREVFTRIWRHTFVPLFYVKDDPQDWRAPWRVVDGARPEDREEWLEGVYSNQTLITELMDQPVPEELGGGTAQVITSSSTLPGLMVAMLDTLDVQDGHQVLEIGTGSGYNAALLSARVSDEHVSSVDIGPALVDAARRRLAAHGFHPHLSAHDGARGVPERAPFDRIIVTCGVPRIPDAWVQQTRPGGIILANLSGPLMGGALARLRVTDDGTAVGGVSARVRRVHAAARAPRSALHTTPHAHAGRRRRRNGLVALAAPAAPDRLVRPVGFLRADRPSRPARPPDLPVRRRPRH
jgi:protein-L-isoaspartate O-methyltransferase